MININNYSYKLDILVNSHGPHEQVRVREPFSGLQRLGVDCKMFRYPFLLEKVIRKKSLVIWQRPRPTSWEEQLYIVRWIRNQNSILLIEWDDHPDLFPEEIQDALNKISMAPFKLSHALHTSSRILANSLKEIQPNSYIFPNGIWRIPELNISKHIKEINKIRIFIGNQNRKWEHQQLIKPLQRLCLENPNITLVIVGDSAMANKLPKENVEKYSLQKYLDYRKIMRSCHIALLPLKNTLPNNCKTEIKWMEAAAESVAVIGGPGLYREIISNNKYGLFCNNIDNIIPMVRDLIINIEKRLSIVSSAHDKVSKNFSLRNLLYDRLDMYQHIWNSKEELDQALIKRFPEISKNLL